MDKNVTLILIESKIPTNLIFRKKDNQLHHYNYYGSIFKDMGDVYVDVAIVCTDRIRIRKNDYFCKKDNLFPIVHRYSGKRMDDILLTVKGDGIESDSIQKIIASNSPELKDLPSISEQDILKISYNWPNREYLIKYHKYVPFRKYIQPNKSGVKLVDNNVELNFY